VLLTWSIIKRKLTLDMVLTFKKIMGPALGIALVSMVAPNSKADVMTFDTSLTSPPGLYFGTGNSNTNFTTETNGTTELGLSVITRYIGPIDPGAGSNVYAVTSGTTSVPGKTGSSWGFDFSIDTQYAGGTDVLDDFTYSLNITDLTTNNVGPTFNPLVSIGDNTGFGSTGKTANTVNPAAQWGAQNSESLSFAGFLPGYDVNAKDLYQITLTEMDLNGSVIETDQVFANATGAPVPEPTSIVLFGTLALGAVVLGRRRLSAAKPMV
jgi:hypothetical protein